VQLGAGVAKDEGFARLAAAEDANVKLYLGDNRDVYS
jgi:hypothetical protein